MSKPSSEISIQKKVSDLENVNLHSPNVSIKSKPSINIDLNGTGGKNKFKPAVGKKSIIKMPKEFDPPSKSSKSDNGRNSISPKFKNRISIFDAKKYDTTNREIVQDNSKISREAKTIVKITGMSGKFLNQVGTEGELANIVKYRSNEPIPMRSNLAIELEDPANESLRPEIQKVMHMINEVNSIAIDYYNIELVKGDIQSEINEICQKNKFKPNFFNQTNCYFFI